LNAFAVPRQQLGIAQDDAPGFARLNRKDLGPNESVARKREQGGVALFPDYLFVNPPRLLGVHHLAAQLLIALEQGEITERCVGGHGIEVGAFLETAPVVAESLLDFKAGDAAVELDADRRADSCPPATAAEPR
jgi:hypothetical protein